MKAMTMQVDKARLDEMLAGLSEKVRAEIMRSASILRPAELATAVDSTIEIHVRQSLRSLRSTEGKDGEPVATMHKSATETLFSKGSVPNLMGFTSQPLYATPEAAEAHAAKLREALTPSGDTKAAYSGEFFERVEIANPMFEDNEDDEPETIMQSVPVSWTTIKEIMAAISARAALTRSPE